MANEALTPNTLKEIHDLLRAHGAIIPGDV